MNTLITNESSLIIPFNPYGNISTSTRDTCVWLGTLDELYEHAHNTCFVNDTGYYNPCTSACYRNIDYYRSDAFASLWFEPYGSIIYGWIYPALIVLTLLANVLVVMVLTRPHMRTPTNTVLLYMALADLAVALVPFPFLCHYFMLGGRERMNHELSPWWCYLAHYSATDVLPPLCHHVSIWLTVVLAAQRLLYLRLPHRAGSICTVKHVNIATAVVCGLTIIGILPKFVDVQGYDVLNFQVFNSTVLTATDDTANYSIMESTMCIYKYTPLVPLIKENIYFATYYWTRVILFVFIPSCLLIGITIALIRSIQEAQQRRNRLFAARNNASSRVAQDNGTQNNVNLSPNSKHNSERRASPGEHHPQHGQAFDHTTAMLIIIVVLFLVVNLPQGIILAIFCIAETFIEGGTESILNSNHMSIAMMIDNMLILLTYPINFGVYCSMSAAFRDTFWDILRPERIPANPATQRRTLFLKASRFSNDNNNNRKGNSANGDNVTQNGIGKTTILGSSRLHAWLPSWLAALKCCCSKTKVVSKVKLGHVDNPIMCVNPASDTINSKPDEESDLLLSKDGEITNCNNSAPKMCTNIKMLSLNSNNGSVIAPKEDVETEQLFGHRSSLDKTFSTGFETTEALVPTISSDMTIVNNMAGLNRLKSLEDYRLDPNLEIDKSTGNRTRDCRTPREDKSTQASDCQIFCNLRALGDNNGECYHTRSLSVNSITENPIYDNNFSRDSNHASDFELNVQECEGSHAPKQNNESSGVHCRKSHQVSASVNSNQIWPKAFNPNEDDDDDDDDLWPAGYIPYSESSILLSPATIV